MEQWSWLQTVVEEVVESGLAGLEAARAALKEAVGVAKSLAKEGLGPDQLPAMQTQVRPKISASLLNRSAQPCDRLSTQPQ